MEQFIKDFGNHTDEPTMVMLQNVSKHKVKFDRYKNKLQVCTWLTLMIFLLTICYFNYFFLSQYATDANRLFTAIVTDEILFIQIISLIFFIGLGAYYKKKKEKHEKEFQDLRKEIVQKSSLQWRNPFDWDKRNEVFAKMKKELDINLYHENK